MLEPPVIWRVNRKPRFTALEMGAYMSLDDSPRETLARNMKYERLAQTIAYRDINRVVPKFLSSPTRDQRILIAAREQLESERVAATNPYVKENLTRELRALETFERSLNAIQYGGWTMTLVKNTSVAPLMVEGVRISVYPTINIRVKRERGRDLVGALLVDLAKGDSPKSDEGKARLTRAMTVTAFLVHKALSDRTDTEQEIASAEHCIVFHTHRQERVCSPINYRRDLKNVEAECRRLAREWHAIQPPASFDPRFAKNRD